MAYGNRYNIQWAGQDLKGHLYLDQDGYAGAVDNTLRMVYDSLSYNYLFGDWQDHIIGMQCEFELVNDKDDFFTLLPLMMLSEGEWKVRLVVDYPTSYTLFEGFLNCDTMSQKYLKRKTINFVASSYLSKLDEEHTTSIDTLQDISFINIIDEILRSTGASYNIRVVSTLHAEGDILATGQTLFNKNGFNTEVFWNDEVERETSMKILSAILTSFDAYLYWWKGCWYIERYEDIWKENNTYIEYTTGQSYTATSSGSEQAYTKTIHPIHYNKVSKEGLLFVNQTQTLSAIPGNKTIQINLKDKCFLNMLKSDLSTISLVFDTTQYNPEPAVRTWVAFKYNGGLIMTWWAVDAGKPKSNIINSIKRTIPNTDPLAAYPHKGLMTSFKVTVEENTEIECKFKYAADKPTGVASWDDYTFKFNWYMKVTSIPTKGYITKTGDSEEWTMKPFDFEQDTAQSVIVQGSSFNKVSNTVDVSFTVPIGKVIQYENDLVVGVMKGDYVITLCIGSEVIQKTDADDFSPMTAWYGDITASAKNNNQNNVITGKITSKFLNKKNIELSLYDAENVNYVNGILRGDSYSIRTERWGTTGGDTEIVQKGVCWAVGYTPTKDDAHTDDGAGYDSFTSLITGLSEDTTYNVRAYFLNANGTTVYGNTVTFSTVHLEVGSLYRGGMIGYIYQSGDGPYVDGETHGIIIALTDAYRADGYPKNMWVSLDGRSGDSVNCYAPFCDLGTHINPQGKVNSDLMRDNVYVETEAIKMCTDYRGGNYTDWQLPTIDELSKIRATRNILGVNWGGFSADWYWSSSEATRSASYKPELVSLSFWDIFILGFLAIGKNAWALNFGNLSDPEIWKKNNDMRVRPIRYF